MKIGISTTPLYTIAGNLKNIDGIGTYTAQLCRVLGSQQVSVQEIYFKRIKEIFSRSNSTPNHLWVASNAIQSLLPGSFYKDLQGKIDLLHVTDYFIPRIKTIPVLATIHDAIMLKHPEWSNHSKSIYLAKKFLLKKMAKQADSICTCSYASVEDIVNFWKIPERKISVTYYGLSDIWHQPIDSVTRQEILKKYQLNKPFFLTVGTLQPRKNVERIINVYLHLPKKVTANFNLVIAGKNHPGMTPPSLMAKLQQLEASGQLLWLKYVPFIDLRSLYQSAYALLYPSLAEGFGFPILEGFASATPVITSQFGATAEISGKAAYLVDPYSEEAIGAAIMELIEKPDLRTQLISQGLSQVKQFTWEKCGQQTIALYKQLL